MSMTNNSEAGKFEILAESIVSAKQLLEQPDLFEKLQEDRALGAEVMTLSASLADLASRFAIVAAEVQPGS